MGEPRWLAAIGAELRSTYANEFRILTEHLAHLTQRPDADIKDTSLGISLTYATGSSLALRLTRALIAAFEVGGASNTPFVHNALIDALVVLLRRSIVLDADDLSRLLKFVAQSNLPGEAWSLYPGVLNGVQRFLVSKSLAPEWRTYLGAVRCVLQQVEKPRKKTAGRLIEQIDKICDDRTVTRLHPDDGWADDLREWFLTLTPDECDQWDAFLRCLAAVHPDPPAKDWSVSVQETGLDYLTDGEAAFRARLQLLLRRTPSADWRRRVNALVDELGRAAVASNIRRWLHRVRGSKPGMLTRQSLNRELLRGVLWLSVEFADEEMVQAITQAAIYLYDNNSPLAEACVVVLYQMPGKLGASGLNRLAQRAPSQSQQSFVESVLQAMAERLGVDRQELEDSLLPTFGFAEFGRMVREFDDIRAELRIAGNRNTEILWTKADGRVLKAAPTRVNREHRDAIEDLRATAKSIRETLTGLSAHLEASWLSEKKYSFLDWYEKLCNHPVAGVVGRSLLWRFDDADRSTVGRVRGGVPVDLDDRPLMPGATASVSLWHPLNVPPDEVLAWRKRLEADEVVQPLKQLHR